MSRPMRFLARLPRFVLLLGVLALCSSGAVLAQSYDCDRLRQELAGMGEADPQRAAQYVRAAQRQQAELTRTQAYADQIGCSRSFSIFGNDSPPQCDAIQAQVERMNNNLSALEGQIAQQHSVDPDRRAALEQQLQSACGSLASATDADGLGQDGMRSGFDNTNGDGGGTRRYGKAICVRTCDGGFFPLSFSPAQHDDAGLQGLCTALCPNAEVKLYTTPDLDSIGEAVSVEGAAYKDLPAAFRYQKTFDATCTCKPPNKSWVEALADAEKLLDRNGGKDVIVTAKMSDDMARPVTAATASAAPPSAGPSKKKFSKAQIKALLDAQAAAEGALGAVGAQAPTATTDSAGIASNTGSADHMVKTGEGVVRSVTGPDGAKRRVRTIGPTL